MAVRSDRNRRAGLIYVKINGLQIEAKGNFTVGYGKPKREAIVGADGVHGYKETPQISYVEGAVTDASDLDTAALLETVSATVTVDLNNKKTLILEDAWYSGEGTMSTEEGEIGIRFESRHQITEVR